MNRVSILTILLLLFGVSLVTAQTNEYILDVPLSDDPTAIFTAGVHSGSRAVSGPFDIDGDGLQEFLVADYTGGGRVHVIENKGVDTWELVYSTPWLDETATTSYNARYATASNADADLDGDGMGEIILPTGRSFSATNPNYTTQGLYVFEYTGVDDNYGDAPASILEVQDRIYVQASLDVQDIDGDGIQEVLFPNNAADGTLDKWYIYSVTGDIGSGFEAWVEELGVPSRPDHGGGSPWAIWTPDLDGDGAEELLFHSWNYYNFTLGAVTGADSYDVPGGVNYAADHSSNTGLEQNHDGVVYAGGVVVDINDDGDEEVYMGGYSTHDPYTINLINYEAGEDVTQMTADNIVIGLLPETFTWGLTAGDMDGDGQKEVIGVGYGYSGADYGAGVPSHFVRVAEFVGGQGGDPEDPANYEVEYIDTGTGFAKTVDGEDGAGFDTVHRDSAGTQTTYYEPHGGEALFAFRAAYLGDADNDGFAELALGFQSVADSVDVIDEVWNADSLKYIRTTRERVAAAARPFARVISGSGLSVTTERIVVPSDYKLSANYPNPFNPTTTFSFTLPIDKTVSVRIYDMTGRLVKSLINNQSYVAGTYDVTWDATNDAGSMVASGTYIYSLEYGNFRQSRTMVLIK